MDTAKIFMDGKSQAVRLPKKYRFSGTEVTIQHFEGGVLLLPKKSLFEGITAALDILEPGFEIESQQTHKKIRSKIKA
jgi:antitoxin VapB